jgi:hypothetical protein
MRNTLILTALLFSFSISAAPLKKKATPTSVPTPAPDLKYEAAIDSLQELQSARSVGINQRDFGTRVTDLKIKVDKLGNDSKYTILKETTQALIDANMMWNGSIGGSLPVGTLQGIKDRYAKYPHVLGPFLSRMEGDDSSLLHGEAKQAWKIEVGAAKDMLLLMAQRATVEALGKAPAGAFASEMADTDAILQKKQDAERK